MPRRAVFAALGENLGYFADDLDLLMARPEDAVRHKAGSRTKHPVAPGDISSTWAPHIRDSCHYPASRSERRAPARTVAREQGCTMSGPLCLDWPPPDLIGTGARSAAMCWHTRT